MRTTLNIDDRLYRKMKVRAAREDRTVTELVETALHSFMEGASNTPDKVTEKNLQPNRFPTIKTRPMDSHRRKRISIDEMGNRVREAELDFDLERHGQVFRH